MMFSDEEVHLIHDLLMPQGIPTVIKKSQVSIVRQIFKEKNCGPRTYTIP